MNGFRRDVAQISQRHTLTYIEIHVRTRYCLNTFKSALSTGLPLSAVCLGLRSQVAHAKIWHIEQRPLVVNERAARIYQNLELWSQRHSTLVHKRECFHSTLVHLYVKNIRSRFTTSGKNWGKDSPSPTKNKVRIHSCQNKIRQRFIMLWFWLRQDSTPRWRRILDEAWGG